MPYFSQSATVRRQAGKSAGARPGRPPPACEVHAGGPGPACYDAFRGCAVHARPVSSPGPAVGPCGQRQKFLSCSGAPERRTPGAFVIHGTSQERLVVDDGKKTCVRTSSAGSAIIHPNSRSSRRGAFFGAINIEQNVKTSSIPVAHSVSDLKTFSRSPGECLLFFLPFLFVPRTSAQARRSRCRS